MENSAQSYTTQLSCVGLQWGCGLLRARRAVRGDTELAGLSLRQAGLWRGVSAGNSVCCFSRELSLLLGTQVGWLTMAGTPV